MKQRLVNNICRIYKKVSGKATVIKAVITPTIYYTFQLF